MPPIRTEGKEHVPARPAFLVPNRIPNLEVLQELESMLGGAQRVAWLVEETCMPTGEVMEYLRQSRAAGIMGSMARQSGIMLAEQLHDMMGSGRHVVLLTGPRDSEDGATLSDVPGRLLSHMDGCSLETVPVYVGMFNEGLENSVTTQQPCHEVRMRVMPPIRGKGAQSARVLEAWMECSADMFAELPLPEDCSLARMLVTAMQSHAEAKIIDGIDDSELTFRQLLAISLMLARHLRRTITHKRLGVILPPGKRAAIANLACLFAGIAPVNINYTAAPEIVREMMLQAHVTRFITEARFVSLQSKFQWPPTRDLIYIDDTLEALGNGRLRVWRTMLRYLHTDRLLRFLKLPARKPHDEVALIFSGSTSGAPRAIVLTHRMALANLMGLQSRMQLREGQHILSTAPLYCSAGLLPGLLMPLLYGYNMVTYPSASDAGGRLRELILRHGVKSLVATPDVARALIADGQDCPLLNLKYLVAAGGPVPPALARAVKERLQTTLLGSYALSEAGSLVSLSQNNTPTATASVRQTAPYLRQEGIGEPMPGIAVSISDPRRPSHLLPINTPGLVWVRGAALTHSYQDNEEATITNIRNGWLRTGDLGMVDADGKLHIFGTRERYAVVRGEFIPHTALENLLLEGFGETDPAAKERKIAIVSLSDRDARDHLIMLTTLPADKLPPDIAVLSYGIRNEGYSENWCPRIILHVPAIPALPNGRLDYAGCCALAQQELARME